MREVLQERLNVPLEFHPGWDAIVLRLVDNLDAVGLAYEVDQVKEKFGGLRFYWHVPYQEEPQNHEEINALEQEFDKFIREAENEALHTCEICGAPGKMTGKTWVRTACEEHALD